MDEEATCPRTFTDDQGNQLKGEYNYVLHFNNDQLPPVEAFWSVTMYDKDFYLVQNDIERYAMTDYTPGLERNDDGSLEIYIQKCPPINHESIWLPAPEDGFNLLLRMYQLAAKILNGTYEVPYRVLSKNNTALIKAALKVLSFGAIFIFEFKNLLVFGNP